jgi:hypothetical protein
VADHCVSEHGAGVYVERSGCAPIAIEVVPWGAVVSIPGSVPRRFGLHEFAALTEHVAAMLAAEAGSRATGRARRERDQARVDAWVIALRVLGRHATLLPSLEPAVAAVHRALLALPVRVPSLAEGKALYRERYVVQDVVRYRAAAVALAFVESRLLPATVRARAAGGAVESDTLIEALAEWRGLFSPGGHPYRSLNRTLMNLPRRVPPALLCELRGVSLERPVTGLLALTALLLRARWIGGRMEPETRASQLRILQHAREDDIGAAVERVGGYMGRPLDASRLRDVRTAVGFVADYPEPYGGRLGGLVERAVRWHERTPETRAVLEREGGVERPTARPPVALPEVEGIEFLATVGAIVEEGARMRHCVGTYVAEAVAGRSFFFHVRYRGEDATVQVDPGGRVRQASGPRNTENLAVRWGARQLRRWGRQLRAEREEVARAERERQVAMLAAHARWIRVPAALERQLAFWP